MFPQRFNRTNFVTTTVAGKIIEAMRAALGDGLQHYVENKHGQRWLRVCIRPVDGSDSKFTFEFHAGNGQQVGHLILEAMFNWHRDQERAFSELLGELYHYSVHPYTAARQAEREAKRKKVETLRRDALKGMGVTHSFRTMSGHTLLGRYKRDWLGRKTFEALADHKGTPYAKPFKLDREAYLYGTTQGFAV